MKQFSMLQDTTNQPNFNKIKKARVSFAPDYAQSRNFHGSNDMDEAMDLTDIVPSSAHTRKSIGMDLTECVGNFVETTSKIAIHAPSRKSIAMELTQCVGDLLAPLDETMDLTDVLPSSLIVGRRSIAMDMTECVGDAMADGDTMDLTDLIVVPKPPRKSVAMEMTLCVGDLLTSDAGNTSLINRSVLTPRSPQNKPINRKSIAMEMTQCVSDLLAPLNETMEMTATIPSVPYSSRNSIGFAAQTVGDATADVSMDITQTISRPSMVVRILHFNCVLAYFYSCHLYTRHFLGPLTDAAQPGYPLDDTQKHQHGDD